MNARQRRKAIKARSGSPNILVRLEAKTDMLLEQTARIEKRCAVIGAVSGGIAGGIAGGVVSFAVAYFKAMLLGVR